VDAHGGPPGEEAQGGVSAGDPEPGHQLFRHGSEQWAPTAEHLQGHRGHQERPRRQVRQHYSPLWGLLGLNDSGFRLLLGHDAGASGYPALHDRYHGGTGNGPDQVPGQGDRGVRAGWRGGPRKHLGGAHGTELWWGGEKRGPLHGSPEGNHSCVQNHVDCRRRSHGGLEFLHDVLLRPRLLVRGHAGQERQHDGR